MNTLIYQNMAPPERVGYRLQAMETNVPIAIEAGGYAATGGASPFESGNGDFPSAPKKYPQDLIGLSPLPDFQLDPPDFLDPSYGTGPFHSEPPAGVPDKKPAPISSLAVVPSRSPQWIMWAGLGLGALALFLLMNKKKG